MERPGLLIKAKEALVRFRNNHYRALLREENAAARTGPRSVDQIQREDYNNRWRMPRLH